MKRFVFVVVCMVFLGLPSCKPAATDAELDAACANLLNVRGEGEVPSEAEMLQKIREEFVGRQKRLQAWKEREMKSWDEELKVKLEMLNEKPEAERETTPEALKKEYAKKKEVGAEQFNKDLAELKPVEQEAIDAGKAKIAAKIAEIEEMRKKCVEDAKKEGIDQELAKCRAAAPDKDAYWNKCK